MVVYNERRNTTRRSAVPELCSRRTPTRAPPGNIPASATQKALGHRALAAPTPHRDTSHSDCSAGSPRVVSTLMCKLFIVQAEKLNPRTSPTIPNMLPEIHDELSRRTVGCSRSRPCRRTVPANPHWGIAPCALPCDEIPCCSQ